MMNEKKQFHFTPVMLAVPLYFVLFLWVVLWVEARFGLNFNKYGIYPRTFKGLRGIFFSTFIHGGVVHLYQNSFPLLILIFNLFYFYRKIAFKIMFYGILLTGVFTWIIGRPSYHIGASGLIYLLFSFIFFSGIFRKYYRLLAISLMVIFLYGSIVWYMFPIKDEVSWEGHVSGFVAGIILAYIFRGIGPQKEYYDWELEDHEPDEFERSFDENGNVIIHNDEEEGEDKI
jgi:membrane associated rhomboid family serine protease